MGRSLCESIYKPKNDSLNKIEPYIDHSMINKNFKGKTPTLVELIKQPIWKRYRKGASGIPKDTFKPDYLRFERKANPDYYVFISLMLSTIVQIGQMIQFQGHRALKMFQNNIYIILPTEMYWKDIRLAK